MAEAIAPTRTSRWQSPRFGAHQPGPRAHVRDESARLAALRFDGFTARPLSPTIGAELEGVDLAHLDDRTFAEVRRAWLEHKVIFLRDQACTDEQQMAFARRFGELEVHPFLPANATHDEIIRFEKGDDTPGYENLWHSDVSWREIPSLGSVLRCIEAPPRGGDTLFADMTAAYEGLPDDVKGMIDDATAVHDFVNSFGLALDEKTRAEKRKEFPPARHPVVRTHPETGRKILYVNSVFTSHIEGMERSESDALLDYLYRHATVPEYQCRFHWTPRAVAFWDNRAVQHYASNDYWPDRRVMERVTIIGDRPR
jgi:taurine dioxygenase